MADTRFTRPARLEAILAFLAIYVIWGSTFLAIRYAVESIPPLFTAATRHLIAGSILLGWALWKGERPTRQGWRAGLVLGFLFFFLSHGLLHWAELKVPSGAAALVIAIEPAIVALLLPLSASGETQRIAGAMKQAAELALIDAGNAGITLITKDTAGTPNGASAAAESAR